MSNQPTKPPRTHTPKRTAAILALTCVAALSVPTMAQAGPAATDTQGTPLASNALSTTSSTTNQHTPLPYAVQNPLASTMPLDANTPDDSTTLALLAEPDQEGIDLTALINETTGTGASITLRQGGTYYLSDDVVSSKYLIIKAPGEDVTIRLKGHTLTFDTPTKNQSTQAQGILLTSAKSLTIEGSVDTVEKAQLVLTSSSDTVGLGALLVDNAPGATTVIRNVGMSVGATGDGTKIRNLAASAIRHMKGSLSVDGCAITVDLSNQTEVNNTAYQMTGCPVGIYTGLTATSYQVTNTAITVRNTPNVPVDLAKTGAFESVTGNVTPGNAYGIYSQNETTPLVADGLTIDVSSPLGIAMGMCVNSLSLVSTEGNPTGNTVNVNAAQRALAIDILGSAGSALIDAPLDATYDGTSWAPFQAALYSKTEGAFIFGPRLTSDHVGVLVGALDASPNANDLRVGTFSEAVADDNRETIAARLENALGTDEPCQVSFDDEGLFFHLDVSRSAARIVAPTGEVTYYSSAQKALDDAAPGHTVILQKNATDLAFTKDDATDQVYTLDLDGHTVSSLTCAGTALLHVKTSTPGGAIQGPSSPTVSLGPASRLSCTDCTIACTTQSQRAIAISLGANATLETSKAAISAFSSTSKASAISIDGSGATLALNDTTVSATTFAPTESALAVVTTQGDNTITVTGGRISASTVAGVCGAIDSASDVSVKGTALEAKTDSDASFAWGIRLTGQQAKGDLDNTSISTNCATGKTTGQYWCIQPDSALGPGNDVTWSLAGTTSFTSINDTAICQNSSAMRIDPTFASTTGSIPVVTRNLSSDVFCVTTTTGTSIAPCASYFYGAPGTMCQGWECIVDPANATQLLWKHASVVRIASTGATFADLASAMMASVAGDTLTLIEDCTQNSALDLNQDVTIDLAGHSLTVDAFDKAASNATEYAGALRLTGGSTVRLTDTSTGHTGTLRLKVGSLQETVTSVERAYRGFVVGKDATLVLDGCDGKVVYAGRGVTDKARAIGCTVAGGSLRLTGDARLSVEAELALATQLKAVELDTDATSFTVDHGCKVIANNTSAAITQGALPTSKSLSTNTGVTAQNVNLVQIFPEEGSALYEEIQDKFRQRAKYDGSYLADPSDDSAIVYGTRCFYATHLALDNGRLVWAFSDPVAQEDAGELERVVATTFFTPARYDAYPTATAVAAPDGFQGVVSIHGTITAECPAGDATGLDLPGSARGLIGSDAAITAHACEEPGYRQGESFDLRDHLPSVASELEALVFPKNDKQHLVTYQKGVASAASDALFKSAVTVESGATLSSVPSTTETDPLADIGSFHADTVCVTFEGARDEQGSIRPSTTLTRDWAAPVVGATSEIPQASDYVSQGITYRFVGWTTSTSSGTLTLTPSSLDGNVLLDDSLSGSREGAVTLRASYQAVTDTQYLASFVVDSYVFSYAAEKGSRPQYHLSRVNQQSDVPAKIDAEENRTYSFQGWAPVAPKQSAPIEGTLPASSEDITYEARFLEGLSRCNVSFVMWTTETDPTDNTTKATKTTLKQVFDYYQDPSEAASALAQEHASFVIDGNKRFTFQGWSARPSDETPVFGDTLPATYCANVTYYALYAAEEVSCTVNFYLGDTLYATVPNVAPTSSIDAAWRTSGKDEPAAQEDHPFRGWGLTPDADKRVTTNLVTAQELADATGVVNLYALFKTDTTIVDPPASDEDDDNPVTTPDGEKNQAPEATDIDIKPSDQTPIDKTPTTTSTTVTPTSVTTMTTSAQSAARSAASTSTDTTSPGTEAVAVSSTTTATTKDAEAVAAQLDPSSEIAESNTSSTVAIALAVIAALLGGAWGAKRAIENTLTRRKFKAQEQEAAPKKRDTDEGIVF